MEAIFSPSAEQYHTISPYKKMKNPTKRNTINGARGLISRPTDQNMAPAMNPNNLHASLFFRPPQSLSFSYPPPPYYSVSVFNNNTPHHPLQNVPRHQQPPLLPFPIIISKKNNNNNNSNNYNYNSLPSRTKSLSFSPSTKKTNRKRDQSLTPKKSKQPTKRPQEPRQEYSLTVEPSSTVPLGPDPNDLPKGVLTNKVISPSSSFSSSEGNNRMVLSDDVLKDLERFSGSVFTVLSPPPSSLPLPKFSVRPKLMSCTAEAAGGVDAGATDNLCRLLRLR